MPGLRTPQAWWEDREREWWEHRKEDFLEPLVQEARGTLELSITAVEERERLRAVACPGGGEVQGAEGEEAGGRIAGVGRGELGSARRLLSLGLCHQQQH